MYPSVSGICYDPCTDDYKVLIGLESENSTPTCRYCELFLVAGLKDKHWKHVESPYGYHSCSKGVLISGFLHWEAYSVHFSDESHKIFAFDPKTNVVSEVPLPLFMDGEKFSLPGLGVLDGCLSITCRGWDEKNSLPANIFEVFTMREYGNQESWIPLFEISNSYHELPCYMKLTHLFFMRNGDVLMLLKHRTIFRYNPRTKRYIYFKVEEDSSKYGALHLLKVLLRLPVMSGILGNIEGLGTNILG
ncbi:hypothetical protein ACH5RR_031227 [Cinchona calisaya]|uniref:F-box associated beta-propeller type 3 domain-containing protein n=1 Tax=Cinchona calisaya TaxID=153742 RepID=A0ABD2YI27_9GENT